MRRLLVLLALPVVALAVLVPAGIASADLGLSDSIVVGTQAGLPEDFAGTTPGDANATENAFRPEEYEPNFLWGAAWGLSVLTVAGVGLLGGLYWLTVLRPRQQADAA